jgi:hypothetical protein
MRREICHSVSPRRMMTVSLLSCSGACSIVAGWCRRSPTSLVLERPEPPRVRGQLGDHRAELVECRADGLGIPQAGLQHLQRIAFDLRGGAGTLLEVRGRIGRRAEIDDRAQRELVGRAGCRKLFVAGHTCHRLNRPLNRRERLAASFFQLAERAFVERTPSRSAVRVRRCRIWAATVTWLPAGRLKLTEARTRSPCRQHRRHRRGSCGRRPQAASRRR